MGFDDKTAFAGIWVFVRAFTCFKVHLLSGVWTGQRFYPGYAANFQQGTTRDPGAPIFGCDGGTALRESRLNDSFHVSGMLYNDIFRGWRDIRFVAWTCMR
ncbi:MAG: hypothetical protein AMXMBFR82_13810 [Candidatus Hydrogenedentota bacterium]